MGGVSEYWLVDFNNQTIRQYERFEEDLILKRTLTISDTLRSSVLVHFDMPMTRVFE